VCGVVAGPAFVIAFAAIGARRSGYDWRRHAVSSLADGRGGWAQRADFMIAGALYCVAATGLAQSPRKIAGPLVVPAIILGAAVGLIGSGAIPIVAGIPVAALTCAGSAARGREYRWATYCAGSGIGMIGTFLLFGAASQPASCDGCSLEPIGGPHQRGRAVMLGSCRFDAFCPAEARP
jgi:hypothetical protein